MPFVMNQAMIRDSARPSQPVCSSQSLRFQMSDLGTPLGTVAPGTKMMAMTAMTTTGMATLHTTRSHVGTVSLMVNGKLFSC